MSSFDLIIGGFILGGLGLLCGVLLNNPSPSHERKNMQLVRTFNIIFGLMYLFGILSFVAGVLWFLCEKSQGA